ncbi:MAG: GMC family oxidoreductase N-terminal domain-containing protein, partial [Pseudomonadales bacterium]
MNSTKLDPDTPARHWLSQGFEELAVRCERKDDATALDFDVVIVGSGYGAAVAAYHLAGKAVDGKALSVAILERGGEYLNGMFPSDPGDLVPQLRWALPGSSKAQGSQEGLFDIRFGPGITSIVANGLGGGSLINAGVMLRPRPAVFDTGWPADMDYQSLESHFETCEELLRARPLPHRVAKFEALNRLSSANRVPVTIATDAGDEQPACTLCGNCVTGCNFGAKLSLDISLLARAMERNDQVECFTGATVLKFWQEKTHDHNPTWCVDAGFTNEDLANRLQAPVTIRCRYLIIAAGTFGSTELLMRSENQELAFSPALGKGFSMNGDLLAFGYGQKAPVKAIARQP